MYRIGLTGGIASGKSTVSAMLAELGAKIIDTDEIARQVVQPGELAWQGIVNHFGRAILLPDGQIDRKSLGDRIFQDKTARQQLEKIIHPYIEMEVEKSVEQAAASGQQFVVLDVPLLFEIGWQTKVNSIWVVYVEPQIQLARLMARNQFTTEQALDRINSQMKLGEKVKKANVIIDNNLDINHARKQVILAWRSLEQSLVSM